MSYVLLSIAGQHNADLHAPLFEGTLFSKVVDDGETGRDYG